MFSSKELMLKLAQIYLTGVSLSTKKKIYEKITPDQLLQAATIVYFCSGEDYHLLNNAVFDNLGSYYVYDENDRFSWADIGQSFTKWLFADGGIDRRHA